MTLTFRNLFIENHKVYLDLLMKLHNTAKELTVLNEFDEPYEGAMSDIEDNESFSIHLEIYNIKSVDIQPRYIRFEYYIPFKGVDSCIILTDESKYRELIIC